LAIGIWLLVSNPTLAAKLKKQEPASQQESAPHFMVEEEKRADAVLASRLTSAAEAG